MKSLGCLCFQTTHKIHRIEFEPRTTPHVFVGYPFEPKGYKVLNLLTRNISIFKHVAFHENIFPFHLPLSYSLFPSFLHSVLFVDPVYDSKKKSINESIANPGDATNIVSNVLPDLASYPISTDMSIGSTQQMRLADHSLH